MAAPMLAAAALAHDKHTESDWHSEGRLIFDRQSMLLLHTVSKIRTGDPNTVDILKNLALLRPP